jgi:NTP pyrophosphatase (non-canonical NTP hydrolase)
LGWSVGSPTAIASSAVHSIGNVCSQNSVITINHIKGEIMSDKNNTILGLQAVIGYINATTPNKWMTSELIQAISFIENTAQHEEYKAAWLNIVNTLHCIDPNWQKNTQGESEWEKAVAFISQLNQALKKTTDTIDSLFKAGQHTLNIFSPYPRFESVYFRDLLRSVALTQIKEELAAAEKKHPTWPKDTVHASAILNEEAGELTQAAIDYHYDNGSLEKVRREAAQVGAMAIRVLINLPYAERPAASEKKVTGAAR